MVARGLAADAIDRRVVGGSSDDLSRYPSHATGRPDHIRPGQESVWDYPRPAVAEPTTARIRIELGGVVIADTGRVVRTLETSHPPSYYIPLEDIMPGVLVTADGSSFCEWKGYARYFDVIAGGERRERAA